ncbi:AlpA family phage regulatory protein [Oceanicola sp. 502str15]|nr:AlpA family phage regulatory protein [Oceanicola sp. 502str15]MCO6384622.1 AlpA family phage regulatory protein [Oceanicola sp. 502str15]
MQIELSNAKPWTDCSPSGRLLRPVEVFERTGLSRSQVYAMIAEGTFPPFLKLSKRASAMPEAWVDCFVEARARSAIAEAKSA